MVKEKNVCKQFYGYKRYCHFDEKSWKSRKIEKIFFPPFQSKIKKMRLRCAVAINWLECVLSGQKGPLGWLMMSPATFRPPWDPRKWGQFLNFFCYLCNKCWISLFVSYILATFVENVAQNRFNVSCFQSFEKISINEDFMIK